VERDVHSRSVNCTNMILELRELSAQTQIDYHCDPVYRILHCVSLFKTRRHMLLYLWIHYVHIKLNDIYADYKNTVFKA